LKIAGKVGAYGAGNNIWSDERSFRRSRFTRYLCGQCGYSEEWVESASDLQKLRQKYGE